MSRIVKLLLLSVFLGAPLGACASVMPLIPTIVSIVTDAMLILDSIDSAVQRYFAAHPDPELQTQYAAVYARTLAALNAAQHSLAGATELDQQRYDEAFAEFRQAYEELVTLLESKGLLRQGYLQAGVGTEPVYVPRPEALTYRVAQ